MSLYEQIKKHRERELEQSIRELERLAENHGGSTHYLTNEAYKSGIRFAIREIEGTEMLYQKAHKELPYANKEEAEREHKNQMNTLATIKAALIRRYEGKP